MPPPTARRRSRQLAPDCDLVLVIGAPNSSNSLRLVEVAERLRHPGQADPARQRTSIPPGSTESATLGLTAGASAPEILVREVIARLGEWREVEETTMTSAEEKMVFKLPRQLTD
jgi:4-hydroxy-3-methylbut-2-en-1-yl diphosphate reductase